MIYLFSHQGTYYLGDEHPRKTHPGSEVIGIYKKIQDAQMMARKLSLSVTSLLQKSWTGLTPEGLQRIREAKVGHKNPNAAGLSDTHKRKIAATMKKHRRGEHHHFYNMRHSPTNKLKISLGMKKLGPRRWVLSPEGREHFVYLPFLLPSGWTWGRKRFR
jgi:hypothetical protein